MRKLRKSLYLVAAMLFSANALAQTAPTKLHPTNEIGQPWDALYVPGFSEWVHWFQSKLDYINPWLIMHRAPDKTVFLGSAGPNPLGLTEASNFPLILGGPNPSIGLYQHANGNAQLTTPQNSTDLLPLMWSIWGVTGVTSTGQGQSVAEIGGYTEDDFTGPGATPLDPTYPGYFGGAYPNEVNMNILTGDGDGTGTYTASVNDARPGVVYTGYYSANDLLAIKSAIREAVKLGAQNVAVFSAPNGGGEDLDDPFATAPFWANFRAAALYGGAIALDTPPNYYFARSPAYQAMIIQMILWGKAQGIRVSVTVSPYATLPDAEGHLAGCGYDPTFAEATLHMVSVLKAANAMPSQWIVEAYGAVLPPTTNPVFAGCGTENDIATDYTPESLNAVALLLANSTVNSPPGISFAYNGIADAGLQSSPTPVPTIPLTVIPTSIVRLGQLGTMAFMDSGDFQIDGAKSTIGLPNQINFVNTNNLQASGNISFAPTGGFNFIGLPTVGSNSTQVWLNGNVVSVGITGSRAPSDLVDTVNLQATGAINLSGQAFGITALPTCVAGLGTKRLCVGNAGGSIPLMQMP